MKWTAAVTAGLVVVGVGITSGCDDERVARKPGVSPSTSQVSATASVQGGGAVPPTFTLRLDIGTALDDAARLRSTVYGLPFDIWSIDDDYDGVDLAVTLFKADQVGHLDLDFCNVFARFKDSRVALIADENLLGAEEVRAAAESRDLRHDLNVVDSDLKVAGAATPALRSKAAEAHQHTSVLLVRIAHIRAKNDDLVMEEVGTALKEFRPLMRACGGIR